MHDYPDFPESKVKTAIIDSHIHLDEIKYFPEITKTASRFNVNHFVGITSWSHAKTDYRDFEGSYSGMLRYAFYTPRQIITKPDSGKKKLLDHISSFKPREKLKVIKLWCGSRFFSHDSRIDTPAHHDLYRAISDLGMVMMVHISDPDCWYANMDVKRQQLEQFINIVENNPGLKIIGVHMAGNSERLAELSSWLDDYPNLYVDTSATKWVTRELSRQQDEAKKFFTRHASRILYGSDLVNSRKNDFYYFSRYWTHRMLLETGFTKDLPFEDPDSEKPVIRGLNLSSDILEKIYFRNPGKLFEFGLTTD